MEGEATVEGDTGASSWNSGGGAQDDAGDADAGAGVRLAVGGGAVRYFSRAGALFAWC